MPSSLRVLAACCFASGILSIAIFAHACTPAERQEVKTAVIVDTEACAIPAFARLAACYAAHDKGCVLAATSVLVQCMEAHPFPTPIPNLPAVDAGVIPAANLY